MTELYPEKDLPKSDFPEERAQAVAVIPNQPSAAIGHVASRGLLWMGLQTVASKFIGLGGQLVLAWLLTPTQLGLVSIAYSCERLIGTAQSGGAREMLIQRRAHYGRWANPAFWLCLATGILTGLVMLLAAPIVAAAYGERQLFGLIAVLAATSPLAVGVVAIARLQIDFRFRLLAIIGFAVALANTSVAILFAWLGAGAYAIPAGFAASVLVSCGLGWWFARPPIQLNPQIKRWRYLYGASGQIIGARIADAIISQADFLILGRLRGADVLGIYYFAFNLSIQTLMVLGVNLELVLFPTLSLLQDDRERQRAGFIRASQLLAVTAIPICVLQAAVAGPVVHLLFPTKWYPAIKPLQILSIAMALRTVAWPSQTLLQSRGLFRTYLYLSCVRMVGFIAAVVIGSMISEGVQAATYVAIAVAVFFVIEGPINMYIALRSIGGAWQSVGKILFGPAILSALAFAGAFAVAHVIFRVVPPTPLRAFLLTAILGPGFYSVLVILLMPEMARELRARVGALLLARRKAPANVGD